MPDIFGNFDMKDRATLKRACVYALIIVLCALAYVQFQYNRMALADLYTVCASQDTLIAAEKEWADRVTAAHGEAYRVIDSISPKRARSEFRPNALLEVLGAQYANDAAYIRFLDHKTKVTTCKEFTK